MIPRVKEKAEEIRRDLLDKLNLANSYKAVFSSPDGERVLRHLMKAAGLVKPKLTTDVNSLLIRQGQQQIVLSILRAMNKDTDYLMELIRKTETDD